MYWKSIINSGNPIRIADAIRENALDIAHACGFTLLRENPHKIWLDEILLGNGDYTLQAHRGSYKTTAVSVAIAILMLTNPNSAILFMRKTDTDVSEIIAQVRKMLLGTIFQGLAYAIYGKKIVLTKDSQNEIDTNLRTNARGTSQLLGIGVNGSLTGKHYDIVFTDDIINVKDRVSRAERDHTKLIYQELQNVRNRGGRIINAGTPWHKDDAFSIMPPAKKYDYRQTGLINAEQIESIRASMSPSLFAANYELRHIADDNMMFISPQTGADRSNAEQGICHVDAAYGGDDYTAFTICARKGGKFYIYGRLWHKHIDDVTDEIQGLIRAFNAGRIYCEDNGDKGYLGKELRRKGERVRVYHESMNKHLKICSYLKSAWGDVAFVDGTDEEYISQICDYTENAEHDDAPDSLACCIRILWSKNSTTDEYTSLWAMKGTEQ